MADSSPALFSSTGSPSGDAPPAGQPPAPTETTPQSDAQDVINALREALAEGKRPPASIIHAATEFARILTGASGVALALRMKGLVVCRARSGEIAPELGSHLDGNSGISGECLRSAAIQLCNDTDSDRRVDPEACRSMGIRSLVAVPLRGPSGIAGILEAFSTRTDAFGEDAINTLRGLAEIAEKAYAQECDVQAMARPAATSTSIRSALFAKPVAKVPSIPNQIVSRPATRRRYGILWLAIIALLLTSAVAWYSWSDSTPELAASEPAAKPTTALKEDSGATSLRVTPLKPPPGIETRQSEKQHPAEVLHNAAKIESVEDEPRPGDAPEKITLPTHSSDGTRQSATPSPSDDPPPPVEIAASNASYKLPGLTTAPAPLPALEVRVSQGVTQATLIHKVDPTYPPQARVLRLDGSVTLEATIDEKGNVRQTKVLSGPPLLAAAAAEAVRQWRYSPPLLSGKPIESQRKITIMFKLP